MFQTRFLKCLELQISLYYLLPPESRQPAPLPVLHHGKRHNAAQLRAQALISNTPSLVLCPKYLHEMSLLSPASFVQTLALRESTCDLLLQLHARQAARDALQQVRRPRPQLPAA